MALSENIKGEIQSFVTAVTGNYDNLVMRELSYLTAPTADLQAKYTGQAYQTALNDNKMGEIELEIQSSWKGIHIPPRALFKIIDGIMWPSISKIDGNGAFSNSPDGVPSGNTMRGVMQKYLFNSTGKDMIGLPKRLKACGIKAIEDTANKLIATYKGRTSTSDTDRTEILSTMFSTEIMAKTVFIISYCCSNRMGGSDAMYVCKLMAYDPFLGYVGALNNWMAGDTVLEDRGMQANYRKAYDDRTKNNILQTSGTTYFDDHQKWLGGQTEATNYTQLSNQFSSDPQSIINMFVILNERGLLDIGNEFGFPQSTKDSRDVLGKGRLSFAIEY